MKKLLYFLLAMLAVVLSVALFSGCGKDNMTYLTSTTCLWPAIDNTNSDGLYGYIDANGRMAIPAKYVMAYPFSCNRAIVMPMEGETTWACIEPNGKEHPMREEPSTDFYFAYNLLPVQGDNNMFGMINPDGQVVIGNIYAGLGSASSDGLIVFARNGKYGYIDIGGKEVIPAKFDDASPFAGGVALVFVDGQNALIDKQGNYLIEPQDMEIINMGEGRIAVQDDETHDFFICDTRGNKINNTSYSSVSVSPYNEGLAVVTESETGLNGYINLNGDLQIAGTYFSCWSFVDGVAWAQREQNGRYELIDTSGKILCVLRDKEIPETNCINGLALVWTNGGDHYRYINKKGETIYEWPLEESNAAPRKKMPDMRYVGLKNAVLFMDLDRRKMTMRSGLTTND